MPYQHKVDFTYTRRAAGQGQLKGLKITMPLRETYCRIVRSGSVKAQALPAPLTRRWCEESMLLPLLLLVVMVL